MSEDRFKEYVERGVNFLHDLGDEICEDDLIDGAEQANIFINISASIILSILIPEIRHTGSHGLRHSIAALENMHKFCCEQLVDSLEEKSNE